MFDVVEEADAAGDKRVFGRAVKKQIQVVDSGLVLLTVPDERGGESAIGRAEHVEEIVAYTVGADAAGSGGEIPTAPRSDWVGGRSGRRMWIAERNALGRRGGVTSGAELAIGLKHVQRTCAVPQVQRNV